jgi:hypothetical protein
MILGIPYNELSTKCIEDPCIAVEIFAHSGFLNDKVWVNIDHKCMTDKVTTELRFLAQKISSKLINNDDEPSPSLVDDLDIVPALSNQQLTKIEENALKAIRNLLEQASKGDNESEGLSDHLQWVYFIDSGGQIQYQKLLQAFMPCASVLILVVNLAEDFSSPSSNDMLTEDGAINTSDHSLSVKEVLQQLVAFVTSRAESQKQIIDSDPVLHSVIKTPSNLSVIAVGTHRDVYDAKCGNKEKIEDKEVTLSHILLDLEPSICFNKHSIMHEFDGRKAKLEVEQRTFEWLIKCIKRELNDKSYRVSIPLKWYCLSLILHQLADDSFGVLSLNDCQEVGNLLELPSDEVISALKFFHILNTVLYYHDSPASDLVFVIPQNSIIQIISELMDKICKHRSRNNPFTKKLVLGGKLSENDVNKHSGTSEQLSKIFPQFNKKLLDLFQHLLVAAKNDTDQDYFMPALLPVVEPHQSTQSTCLLFYFRKGTPMGLFCAVVVHLLSNQSHPHRAPHVAWSLITDCSTPNYSNQIVLSNSLNEEIVLIERLHWFEIHLRNGESVHKNVIREAFDLAIKATIKQRDLVINVNPQYAVYCPCNCPSASPSHIAIFDENLNVKCSETDRFVDVDKSWFEDECSITKFSKKATSNQSSCPGYEGSNLYSKPRIGDLTILLAPVAPQYNTIGTCLHVPMSQLGLDPRVSHQDNLRTTLQWWINNGDSPHINSPVTWDNIIKVFENGPVELQNYELVQKIKQYAISSTCTSAQS